MPYAAPVTAQAQTQPNNSVPIGHRAKCRTCGAVDNVAYRGGDRRSARCGACGGSLARRRAPRPPKIISFVVVRQLNGSSYGDVSCVDLFSAEREAYGFVERGPVARVRVAAVVELLDDDRTGNVRMLRYDNYKQRRQSVVWQGGCEVCRSKGIIQVVVKPATTTEKAVRKFVSCVSCSGLGGELTRRVLFGRGLK